MTKTYITSTISAFVVLALLALGYVFGTQAQLALAGAEPGLATSAATSTTAHLAAGTPTLVFPTSTQPGCHARVITTASSSIQISFSDKQGLVPGVTSGHIQPASTTVAYDGAVYGCDAVRIFSWNTQKITIQESR
jgi:hypothetical protein